MITALIASVVLIVLFFVAAFLENVWSWIPILLMPVVLGKCVSSDDWKQHEREDAVVKAAEWKQKTTPRPLSSTPDGCTVYVFTTDRDHYFTRCGSRVSTETNWKESCGKSCSKEKSDTITTEGNK